MLRTRIAHSVLIESSPNMQVLRTDLKSCNSFRASSVYLGIKLYALERRNFDIFKLDLNKACR